MIGSEVLRDLCALYGKENVCGVDVRSTPPESILEYSADVLKADVSSTEICDLLDQFMPDIVVHAAAHPGGKSLNQASLDVEVNALGSMRIFEWCAEHQRKVLFLSSSIVYGEQPAVPIHESSVMSPGTIYGVAKTACEQWLRILGEGRGLDWVVLRLFSTYGRGHAPSLDQGIVNVMLTQLHQGNHVAVKGRLDRVRDLVHVSDVVRAIQRTIEVWPTRLTLNVCTGRPTTIEGLIDKLIAVMARSRHEVQIVELPATPGDPLYNVGDPSAMAEILGLKASVTVFDGLVSLLSGTPTNQI